MAENWMAWLAAARVPAFLCHHVGDRIDIVSRTTEFASIIDARTAQFDERMLLAQLDSAWPAADGSPAMTTLGDAQDWQCVLQAVDDPPTRCVGIVRHTTTDQRYSDAFFTTVEALPDIVARLDRNHRHLYINPTIERVTGYPAQAFIGKSKRELGLPEQLVRVWEPLVDKVFDTAQPAEQEDELPTLNGPRHFLTRVVPEFGPDGELHTVLSTSHDITELKSLQWQLELLARTDALTSLLNRRGLVERVEAELPRVRRGEGRLRLLLLDVDDFKSINDTFGHLAGDNVLIAIGEVLQQEIGNDDFAARLGGDELCVGLVDTGDAEAEAAVARIRLRINNLGTDERCPRGVSVSIGLTTVNKQDRSVSDLLTRADQQMYREKPGRRDAR